MPELPEVENTRRNLVRAGLPGCTITGVDITWPNTVKKPSAAELAEGLKGRTVQKVQRRGKYLIFPLSGDAPATFMVHLGMTGHPPETEPSHLGHSIGWFEGETLVVDTAYFAPAQWGIGNGVSSSEQKHLIERFTLMGDGRRMRLEYTIEDPVYLTEPVSLSQTFGLDSGYPWQDEYGCDAEASSRHIIE